MNKSFVVTGIQCVIMVDQYEYPERVTAFTSKEIFNELIFHFSGKNTVHFNGEVLHESAETLRFLPVGAVTEYTVEREEWGECIDIKFTADRPVAARAFVQSMRGNVRVAALFRRIFSVWAAKGEGYYFESLSLLYRILAEVQKSEQYLPQKQADVLRPAMEYIAENFHRGDISVEMLAARCQVSYSYFKRLFIKKTGVPPKRYIIQMKINYACDLLRQEDVSLTAVAAYCGFADIYYFSRQFKAYTGITPTAFRNKYKSSK